MLRRLLFLSAIFPLFVPACAAARELCLIVPLSGGQAPFGESIRRGTIFAQEKLASCESSEPLCSLKGTILTIEDSAGEPARAISAAQRLLRSRKCDAFIVFGSPASLAVAGILNREKKLTIAMGSTDKIQEGKPFVFRSMASSRDITEPLVEECRRLGIKTVVSVSSIHDGMLANRDAFESQRGTPYARELEVNPSESDFRAIAAQANALKPDGIFMTLMPPQSSLFAKQVRALGYRGSLFSTNQVESFDELRAAGSAFDGLWYSREGGEDTQRFFDEMKARFPDGNVSLAYLGFDAANILTLALSAPDHVAAIESLANYRGALGTISTVPNHSFRSERILMEVRKGGFQLREQAKALQSGSWDPGKKSTNSQ